MCILSDRGIEDYPGMRFLSDRGIVFPNSCQSTTEYLDPTVIRRLTLCCCDVYYIGENETRTEGRRWAGFCAFAKLTSQWVTVLFIFFFFFREQLESCETRWDFVNLKVYHRTWLCTESGPQRSRLWSFPCRIPWLKTTGPVRKNPRSGDSVGSNLTGSCPLAWFQWL
jgi:hypothetical protein